MQAREEEMMRSRMAAARGKDKGRVARRGGCRE